MQPLPALYDSEAADREERMDAALAILSNPAARAMIRLLAERPRSVSALAKLARVELAFALSMASALDAVGIVGPATGILEPWLRLRSEGLAEVAAYVSSLGRRELRAVVPFPDDAGSDGAAVVTLDGHTTLPGA